MARKPRHRRPGRGTGSAGGETRGRAPARPRRLRLPGAALLLLIAGVAAAEPGEPKPASAPRPTPSPAPLPTPSAVAPGPIAASIEAVVARRLALEHGEPCPATLDPSVPCFPTRVDVAAADRVESPLEALQRETFSGKPEPRRTANGSAVGGISFDPVCAVRSLVKRVRGRNDRYYLYRVWSGSSEQVVLRDTPLEPKDRLERAGLRYELAGEFHGECEAVAAWRKANREAEARTAALASRQAPGDAADRPD